MKIPAEPFTTTDALVMNRWALTGVNYELMFIELAKNGYILKVKEGKWKRADPATLAATCGK